MRPRSVTGRLSGLLVLLWATALVALPRDSARRTIAGVVVSRLTGQPIARALVRAGPYAMLTDGEGRFEFREAAYSGNLRATKPGYLDADGWLVANSEAENGPVEIKMDPEAVIFGKVTDADTGEPIEGLLVSVRTLSAVNGMRQWQQRFDGRTSTEGEYRIPELQAGEYALETEFKPERAPEGDAAMGYGAVEYPAGGEHGWEALTVHPGDRVQADISTRLEKLYSVSGIVEGLPEGAFVQISTYTATGIEINGAIGATRRALPPDGFRLLLPSGTFELRARVFVPNPPLHRFSGPPVDGVAISRIGREPPRMARKLITVGDHPVSGLKLTIEPTATIPVEVSEEAARPLAADASTHPSFYAVFWSAGRDAEMQAYSAEPANADAGPPSSSRGMQESGPLVVRNLQPGEYLLQVTESGGWYTASATCGGIDLTRDALPVTGASAGCTVRMVMRNDTASVAVSLPPGAKEAVTVYLIPRNNLVRSIQTRFAAQSTNFVFDGVAPGSYVLLATTTPRELAWREPESLRRYESEGKRIDVAPGTKQDVQISVLEGEP